MVGDRDRTTVCLDVPCAASRVGQERCGQCSSCRTAARLEKSLERLCRNVAKAIAGHESAKDQPKTGIRDGSQGQKPGTKPPFPLDALSNLQQVEEVLPLINQIFAADPGSQTAIVRGLVADIRRTVAQYSEGKAHARTNIQMEWADKVVDIPEELATQTPFEMFVSHVVDGKTYVEISRAWLMPLTSVKRSIVLASERLGGS